MILKKPKGNVHFWSRSRGISRNHSKEIPRKSGLRPGSGRAPAGLRPGSGRAPGTCAGVLEKTFQGNSNGIPRKIQGNPKEILRKSIYYIL